MQGNMQQHGVRQACGTEWSRPAWMSYQQLCLLHFLEVIDQSGVLHVMPGQDLPEGSDGKQDILVGLPQALELPLELSIAGHVHGVVVLLCGHALDLSLFQLEDLVLFCQRGC